MVPKQAHEHVGSRAAHQLLPKQNVPTCIGKCLSAHLPYTLPNFFGECIHTPFPKGIQLGIDPLVASTCVMGGAVRQNLVRCLPPLSIDSAPDAASLFLLSALVMGSQVPSPGAPDRPPMCHYGVSGERPIGAASFRQHSIQASCQTPLLRWLSACLLVTTHMR